MPSVEVMDEAARRLGAPDHQLFLATAPRSLCCAFKLICKLIAQHEPPAGSPEHANRETALRSSLPG